VHVIARKALREFWTLHPKAAAPLKAWHALMERSEAASLAELRRTFGSADWVEGLVVFDIGGNKYRVIAHVAFAAQRAYVRHVFTHEEYDRWRK
jgi:mRNA interferase HigB